MEAYDKLDVTGDGVITLEDIKGKYSVKSHPKFLNGEMTEEQILKRFLNNFEPNGIKDAQVNEYVNFVGWIIYVGKYVAGKIRWLFSRDRNHLHFIYT